MRWEMGSLRQLNLFPVLLRIVMRILKAKTFNKMPIVPTRVKYNKLTRINLKFCIFVPNDKAMNTKLTLTMEESVIKKAKKYAGKRKRSLSDLIENYLKALTSEEREDEKELTPVVESLKGSFTLPKNFDYKKELTNRLSEKYL